MKFFSLAPSFGTSRSLVSVPDQLVNHIQPVETPSHFLFLP